MKIILSIIISGAILAGLSTVELVYVQKTFDTFYEGVIYIYEKTEWIIMKKEAEFSATPPRIFAHISRFFKG